MSNPFRVSNEIESNKPTRFYSSLQEAHVADVTGGKQTKNSGATLFGGKGDVLVKTDNKEDWLLECKTKIKNSKSISIKKEWFEKNTREMISNKNRHQAIVINFGPNQDNYYIISEEDFRLFLDLLRNNKSHN